MMRALSSLVQVFRKASILSRLSDGYCLYSQKSAGCRMGTISVQLWDYPFFIQLFSSLSYNYCIFPPREEQRQRYTLPEIGRQFFVNDQCINFMRSRQSRKCSLGNIVSSLVNKAKSSSLAYRPPVLSSPPVLPFLPRQLYQPNLTSQEGQSAKAEDKVISPSRFEQWLVSSPKMDSRLFQNTPTALRSSRFAKIVKAKQSSVNPEREQIECDIFGRHFSPRKHSRRTQQEAGLKKHASFIDNTKIYQAFKPTIPSKTSSNFYSPLQANRNLTLKVNNNFVTLPEAEDFTPKWRRRRSLYSTFYK